MSSASDLDRLLAELRAAGLAVGVSEELRARHILGSFATFAVEQGADLLAAIVVKAVAQRAVFDQVFGRWADALRSREPDPANDGRPPAFARPDLPRVAPQPPVRVGLLRLAIALLALLFCGGLTALVLRLCSSPPSTAVDGGPDLQGARPDGGLVAPSPELRSATRVAWVPRFAVQPPGRPLAFWLAGGGLVLNLVLLAALGWTVRRRRYLPDAVPQPSQPGPLAIVPMVPLPRGGFGLHLLSAREEEVLLFGIGRFVAQEPTRRLDALATVNATLRAGGLPCLCFQRARHSREVWLWLDESTLSSPAGPLVLRLCDELQRALVRAGLPVEQARYWGVPDLLTRAETAESFAPSEVEERKDAALVVLLTDGELLAARLADEGTRGETRSLLRGLTNWPHLAFVDFGPPRHLAAHLGPLGLLVLPPDEAPAFLGGGKSVASQAGGTDVRAWAAVCALAPFPVQDEVALWVRERLQLKAPAWELAALRSLTGQASGPLHFARRERTLLLGWLRDAEHATSPAQTLLQRAVLLWRERLDDEAERRQKAEAQLPWQNTAAQQRLMMQRALLGMWDQPQAAIPALYSLFLGGPLREDIRRALAQLGPSDLADDVERGRVALPWRRSDRRGTERVMLQQLGFGGAALSWPPEELRRPGRPWLGLGLVGGVALACLVGVLKHNRSDAQPPRLVELNKPAGATAELRRTAAGTYRAVATTTPVPGEREEQPVALGSQVSVRWERESVACWKVEADGSRSYLCADSACPYRELVDHAVVFVRVCAGEFTMGSPPEDGEAAPAEKPAHRVRLKEFWLGKYEVSNGEYRSYDSQHHSRQDGAALPVTDVSWDQAKRYCEVRGWRLPTEAEWEYAARGPQGLKYPWGDTAPVRERAAFGRDFMDGAPDPVTAYEASAGPFGTQNQAGNVWEWVADCYEDDSYRQQLDKVGSATGVLESPVFDKPQCQYRRLRGGSFGDEARFLRSAVRFRYRPEVEDRGFGFRCVRAGAGQP